MLSSFQREAAEQLVGETLAEAERDLILATLTREGGNRTHAAEILGISIRTMRNKLSTYARQGLDVSGRPKDQ